MENDNSDQHNDSGRLLTFREREVLSLLAEGLTSKQIALEFSLSKHTIDTHRRRMLKKLKCKNTVELLAMAGQMGLLDDK